MSGLSTSGLVLSGNGNLLTLASGSTSFSFGSILSAGSTYAVTVQTAPAGLTCSVVNGTGTVGTASVTNVVVTCAAQAFSLGGTISGLSGAGLVLTNGSDTLTVTANATSFTMPTRVAFGSTYSVAVTTQPAGISCTVANGSGTMPAVNVTNIAVTCSLMSYTLGGTITGLTTTGLVLVNGGVALTIPANATTFTFGAVLNVNSTYAVTVQSAPSGMTCSIASGSGTAGTANVANVVVTCAAQSFTVGGTISGLTTSGLVLANNGSTLSVAANASTFTMPVAVAFGSSYGVTVQTQPSGRTCSVASGSGTMPAANVVNVTVTCTANAYTLGGTVSGLTASGLVLANGATTVNVAANASSFTLPGTITAGTAYSVSVQTQPSGQSCSVATGSGTMPASNVTSVVVTCAATAYTIGGTISGLSSAGLVLANGSDTLTVSSGTTTFTMPASVAAGGTYAIAVQTQPTGKTCSVANGSGTVASSNVTNVAVTCSAITYTLGGTISGLTASGLVLANGTDTVSPATNAGTFTLPTGVAYQSAYNVVVQTQPSGLSCSVSNGSGTMPANNVSSVSVSCSGIVVSGGWAWMGGAQGVYNSGNYGTQGVASGSNAPGGRFQSVGWKDSSGNLWLFSGYGTAATGGSFGRMDDLWRFDTGSNQWTWVGGQNYVEVTPNYGNQNQASSSNTPGGRSSVAIWYDGSNTLWMFGGITIGAGYNLTNDLWKLDLPSRQWTWVNGPTSIGSGGVCGNKGQASTSNVPGARKGAATWVDNSGNLWLFGGVGFDCSGAGAELNDLWKYNPGTNQWTWVTGSSTGPVLGSYGNQGSGSVNNTPGGRQEPSFWKDANGDFWLFGGFGYDPGGPQSNNGEYNDLWKYSPSNGQWTWVSGANVGEAAGAYGTLGVGSTSNAPGARRTAASFVDGSGNFWLFGGYAHDANGTRENINDLWKFQPSTGQWTWVSGSSFVGSSGNYGNLGTASSSTVPPSRNSFAYWTDNSGRFWVFGGEGPLTSSGHLNDLFRY